MAQQTSEQPVQCPKCSATISADYQFTWCPKCNKTFPAEIKSIILARSQKLQESTMPDSEKIPSIDLVSSSPAQILPKADAASTISRQALALVRRYKDAYLVAKLVNGLGGVIKGIGIVAAILLVLGGIIIAATSRSGDATFLLSIVIIVFGLLVGVFSYFFGVLVSAQGQILKASLDGAVNSSPFLTNEHRIEIMSLPE